VSQTFYLSFADILALHDTIMARTGFQRAPLRDDNLLESAIMRPQMVAYYENSDLVRQAALLAIGVSQAQAFVDGNKRTAFAACVVFLWQNGLSYEDDPIELAKRLEAVADRAAMTLDEATDRFEAWLRAHIVTRQA
jgi:death-on-curing protein